MRHFNNSALSPAHVITYSFDFDKGVISVRSQINGEGVPYDVSENSRLKLIDLINDMQMEFDVSSLPYIKLSGYDFLSLFSAMKSLPCEEIKQNGLVNLIFRLGKNQHCSLLSFVYMKWKLNQK